MGLLDVFKKIIEPTVPQGRPDVRNENEGQVIEISNTDMTAFENTGFLFNSPIFFQNGCWTMLLEGDNIKRANVILNEINQFILDIKKLVGIKDKILLNIEDIEFQAKSMRSGRDSYIQYYSFLECCPYTKTKKISKYPVILHYADKFISDYEPQKENFGDVYFLQNGSIGKLNLVFHYKKKMYQITAESNGNNLIPKKVVEKDFIRGEDKVLYQANKN